MIDPAHPRDSEAAPVSVLSPPLPQGPGDRVRWRRLYGSSKALALVAAARRLPGPLLVVTADPVSASRLADEIRFYAGGGDEVPLLLFPDWETLPYDPFSPYQDIVSDRLTVLSRLPSMERGLVLAPVTTLMHRLAPRSFVEGNCLSLTRGQSLDREAFRRRLDAAGYRYVGQVMEHGDYTLRGSLIDLFPMGAQQPYRLDLLDDELDSIRLFDPESQRSEGQVEDVRMLPAREFPLSEEAISRFRAAWRSRFEGNPSHSPVYCDVSAGLAPPGAEYYLPLFFESSATLFDYLPEQATVAMDEDTEAAADAFWSEIGERYDQHCHDPERPLLAPVELFLQTNEVFAAARERRGIRILGVGEEADQGAVFDTSAPVQVPVDARTAEPLGSVKRFLESFDGRVLFVAESKGRRETLIEMFRTHGIGFSACRDWPDFLQGQVPVGLTVAPIEQGTLLGQPRIAILSEAQLFGERAVQRRRRRRSTRDPEAVVRNLTELRLDSPVVHEDHGVGRYLGLFTLEAGGVNGEFIGLEYADGDKLYVPVASLHLISRYTGVDPEHAPLHKLGSGQWQKARAKAARRIHDVAAELLEIYARRAARRGHAFALDRDGYGAFAQGFPFEETADQLSAIDAVLEDMASERPMDRLVCGDVGFGKTEVAMRAAFIAVQGGRQVAVLVPTTLLAQQHFQNFKDRFADWPVRVEHLSRFRGRKEQDSVVAGLADGTVDIVIGTHKLLQAGIAFKRLGLVIIDEEHRFGVRHKDRMKALRENVDILTLTATPIPRTLNLALSGTRDLSIIATPPSRRLAVKTFVREWDDLTIREAVLREIRRGGQVYFLFNEVEGIDRMAAAVAALVPEAGVRVAHGQMREKDLERVMLDFYHRRFNVLVCTTIIESGIDVPNANTIIIQRADRFGLAQLYQLRGRVGRSHHRAYAYLVVPDRRAMTGDALKRLEAIESLEELGVGFTLATHDLEIRGAGEILGEEQSGHIQEIGFALYTELLERAIAALRAGRQPQLDRPLDHGAEIDLRIPALIPEDYLPDVHARLMMYKRIASVGDEDALQELREEMIDRFGPLPEPLRNLFRVTALKLRAAPLGIRKIDLGPEGGRLQFGEEPRVDPLSVIQLVQRESRRYRLEQDNKLRIIAPMAEPDTRFEALERLLSELRVRVAA